MQATGVEFWAVPGRSGAGVHAHSFFSPNSSLSGLDGCQLRLLNNRNTYSTARTSSLFTKSGFSDNAHLRYYNGGSTAPVAIRCSGGKKNNKVEDSAAKKRLKLPTGMSRDMSMMGSGLDNHNLKRKMASEKELKRKRKEEKRNKKKRAACSEESSSSSESSDDECGEVVNMQRQTFTAPPVVEVIQEPTMLTAESTPLKKGKTIEVRRRPVNEEAKSSTSSRSGSSSSSSGGVPVRSDVRVEKKKIEVCMGGKCKRSGGAALLKEFKRVMGDEGTAVGCKCMGKCKVGPNVRLVNDHSRAPRNPLFIGVGLDGVPSIVANFFGQRPD
ncbi:Diacylglycerol O-acyltransferase [Bertholletia excelsa]